MNDSHSTDQVFISKLTEIVLDHLTDEEFSVEILAQEAGMSHANLYRRLKSIKNQDVSKFIREVRLQRAMEMLRNSEGTAAEISFKVGFGSPAYFNKCFHEYFGYPPGKAKRMGSFKKKGKPNPTKRGKIASYVSIIVVFGLIGLIAIPRMIGSKRKISIAVLPFDDLTGQPGNEAFVANIQDAISDELGKISSLIVISKHSTLRYWNSDMLVKDIANELQADIIVEGSVFLVGDSVGIRIQLIDVFPKERHLPVKQEYSEEMQYVLKIPSDVAKNIAHAINTSLTKEEELLITEFRQIDPQTYALYNSGMSELRKGTNESYETAIHYFIAATKIDPEDPFAYSALALAFAIRGHGMQSPEKDFMTAKSLAEKALELDPTQYKAFLALALHNLYTDWDWPLAKESFEKALAINPNDEIANAHFAWYYVLFDDLEKSIYYARKAVTIAPFSDSFKSWLALLYYYSDDYDLAESWAMKALALNDGAEYANLALCWINLQKKEYQKAIDYAEKIIKINPTWLNKAKLGYTYVKAGKREKALALRNEMEEYSKNHWVNPCCRGIIAASLGFIDEAFYQFNDAFNKKNYPITYIKIQPWAEYIQDDPRYDELMQKMNLPYRKEILTSN